MKDKPPESPKKDATQHPKKKWKRKPKPRKLTKAGVPTKAGAPKGGGNVEGKYGGRIGNVGYQPTEEQRIEVRNYAKCFPVHGEHFIARLMGFSRSTLNNYFEDDLLLGRAQMIAGIGAQMINRAMDAGAKTAIGDIEAQKYVLARLGGWTTKVDMFMSGPGGKPVEIVDLSRLTEDELEEYGRLAAVAEGLDPDEVVGDDDND